MSRLPKIVIERLKATPSAVPPSDGPVAPASFQGSGHPDANLLSAFVEKSLTERERAQILDHLSRCTACREIMTLAVESKPAAVRSSPSKQRWSAWSVLRWGALTAALGAAAIVVVLRPHADKRQAAFSRDQHPAVVADATKPAAPPAEVRPEPQPHAANTMAKSKPVARDAGTARAKPKTGLQSGSFGMSASSSRSDGQVRHQVTMATARPPEPLADRNVPAPDAEHEVTKSVGGVGGAIAAGTPAASPRSKTTAAPEEEARLDLRKEAPPNPAAPPMKSESDGAKKDAVRSQNAEVTAAGAIAAPGVAARETRGSESSRMAGISSLSSRPKLLNKRGAVSAQWSISTTGKVQHSEDGRKTWEDVRIADGVTFRAIAAAGSDVWAGGTSGALYHSIDGGLVWNRVNFSPAESPVTEAIVGIELRPPLGVSIILASGQKWVTDNDGQQWRITP